MPTRSTTTSFRLSVSERAALETAAASKGLGPSSFARQAVLAACGRAATVRRRPDPMSRVVGQSLGELGRIGNNINQLARAANRGLPVLAQEVEACRRDLSRLTVAVMARRTPVR